MKHTRRRAQGRLTKLNRKQRARRAAHAKRTHRAAKAWTNRTVVKEKPPVWVGKAKSTKRPRSPETVETLVRRALSGKL